MYRIRARRAPISTLSDYSREGGDVHDVDAKSDESSPLDEDDSNREAEGYVTHTLKP